jgi:SAM-dependent methyltransferase
MDSNYIHGTHPEEQNRLAVLNELLNLRCLEKLSFQGTEHILDIGSGLGLFSRLMKNEVPNGKVVGIEKETDQIKKAMELAFENQEVGNVEWRQGSAYDLPLLQLEWGSFDLVFIRFLLEHLSEPVKVLEEAYKALKPNGKIILVDDDHANFRIAPHNAGFEKLWPAYCRVYKVLGNDPYIGRKLISHLHESGFSDFKADFVKFGAASSETNFHLFAENLIGIISGAKTQIIQLLGIEDIDFDQDIEKIRAWATLPDATLWYAANWAEAIKPKKHKS